MAVEVGRRVGGAARAARQRPHAGDERGGHRGPAHRVPARGAGTVARVGVVGVKAGQDVGVGGDVGGQPVGAAAGLGPAGHRGLPARRALAGKRH